MDKKNDSVCLEEETAVSNVISTNPMEALKKLASSNYAVETSSTSKYITDTLGLDAEGSQALEERIQAHQKKQNDLIYAYIQSAEKCSAVQDNCFCVLEGWEMEGMNEESLPSLADHLVARSQTTGGYFLRWNGKGIVINPGVHFLTHFHKQGFNIQHIDYVIVTRDAQESYSDIKSIYDLNYQLNTQGVCDLHVINYFLNQRGYQNLSAYLKPHFKQERNTVHCLEIFIDSTEVEKMDLCPGISLSYFQGELGSESMVQERNGSSSNLAIRLECKGNDNRTVSMGYLSGMSWSPVLAHRMGRCDLLVAGFDHTRSSDFGKVQYNEDSLGYFGTYSLLEEIAPRLLVCTEFGGKEGDIRLEVTKKMRQEYAYSHHKGTSILPGDVGLYLDLKTLQIRCTVTQKLIEPSQVHLVRTNEAFGRLQYLSSTCCC